MERDKVKIFDADGHIIERDQELYDYLEEPYCLRDSLS